MINDFNTLEMRKKIILTELAPKEQVQISQMIRRIPPAGILRPVQLFHLDVQLLVAREYLLYVAYVERRRRVLLRVDELVTGFSIVLWVLVLVPHNRST